MPPTVPLFHEFEFRCLRQNRRVVSDESRRQELEEFHETLTDISFGRDTNLVRKFIVEAYVRGADYSAENCDFEGNTAVFTKRRYRDKHNRTVCRRVSKKHNHSIKIKAKVRPRGQRSGQWYPEARVQILRKKARTQSLFNLHLAGDWHHSLEDKALGAHPHLMRSMLTANLAVNERHLKLINLKSAWSFYHFRMLKK